MCVDTCSRPGAAPRLTPSALVRATYGWSSWAGACRSPICSIVPCAPAPGYHDSPCVVFAFLVDIDIICRETQRRQQVQDVHVRWGIQHRDAVYQALDRASIFTRRVKTPVKLTRQQQAIIICNRQSATRAERFDCFDYFLFGQPLAPEDGAEAFFCAYWHCPNEIRRGRSSVSHDRSSNIHGRFLALGW